MYHFTLNTMISIYLSHRDDMYRVHSLSKVRQVVITSYNFIFATYIVNITNFIYFRFRYKLYYQKTIRKLIIYMSNTATFGPTVIYSQNI